MPPTDSLADRTGAALVAALDANVSAIRHALRSPRNADLVVRPMVVGGFSAALLFIDGLAHRDVLQMHIIEPCMRAETLPDMPPDQRLDYLLQHVLTIHDAKSRTQIDDAITDMLQGMGALMIDGCPSALALEARGAARRAVNRPVNETVVLGPQEGFVETLRTNLSLIRLAVRSPRLVTEMLSLGSGIPTQCAVVYLDGVADGKLVAEVMRRLQLISADYVSGTGALEQLIEDHPFALMPQICSTERPDRAASFLLEGQILVFVDGSPAAMSMPISLTHLMHAPDDTFLRWQYGSFLRLIRLAAVSVAMFLPAFYVALLVHHHQAIPTVLLASIYDAQARTPLPMILEALLLIMAFHLINEAGLRVPGAMGSSLGVLSALILGQAAVAADLVSPLMIIIVAISGLGTFVVPDYSLSIALKLRQLIYLAAAQLAGFYGIALIYMISRIHMEQMTSLGVPLIAPVAPYRPHNPDIWIRLPLWMQRLRGNYANPTQVQRAAGRMRRWTQDKP